MGNKRRRQKERKKTGTGEGERAGFNSHRHIRWPKLHRKNLRESWPRHHVFRTETVDSNAVLTSITKHNVGVELEISGTEEFLLPLRRILNVFVQKHKRRGAYEVCFRNFVFARKQLTVLAVSRKPFEPSVVYEYLCGVLKSVVPYELFGQWENQKTFQDFLRLFIMGGVGEIFHLKHLMHKQKFSFSKVPWLRGVPHAWMKCCLYAKVLLWLLEQYLVVIVEMHFYVTEMGSGKFERLFYWKTVWQSITENTFQGMQEAKKIEVRDQDTEQENVQRQMYSLRFLPKTVGARPLLRARKQKNEQGRVPYSGPKTNKEDWHTRDLLKLFYSKKLKETIVKDAKTFPEEWSTLHSLWKACRQPGLYFVRVDIADAYGSVKHDILVKILKKMHKDLFPGDGKVTMQVWQLIYDPKGQKKMVTFFGNMACYYDTNFANFFKVEHKEVDTGYLVDRIIQQGTWQCFTVQGKPMRLICGLSQGGKLSSYLCGLYLMDMESKYLSQFHNKTVLMFRNVDDYLFISPSQEVAQMFLNIMKNGIPEYGCMINNKTQTNLNTECSKISFRGFVFDTKTLEIESDYSCYKGRSIACTMLLNVKCKPGQFVKDRLCHLIMVKLNPLVVDERINSFENVLRNVFQACLLVAFRFHSLASHVLVWDRLNGKFFMPLILKCGKTINTWLWITTRLQMTDRCCKYEMVGFWLFYRAFQIKLMRHSYKYGYILRKLRRMLKHLVPRISPKVLELLKEISAELPAVFNTLK